MTNYVSPESVGVEVGSVFYSTWGYDQTNVTFFKVVGLTPKGVRVIHIGSEATDECHVIPKVDSPVDNWRVNNEADRRKPLTKRLTVYSGRPTFNWTSYADAYLYDLDAMKPAYETPWYAGH